VDVEQQIRVQHLLAQYTNSLDSGRFEEWPEYFTKDCIYKIISAENFERDLPLGVIDCDSRDMLRDRIMALREANIYEDHRYRHILSTTLIKRTENDTIFAETGYQVTRIMRDGSTMIFSTGCYYDRIIEDAGQFKFKQRLVVFDSRGIDTLLVIPL
jgi:anthranilate 1,2-dioxygenase small subunit|tara:strand:+ start:417 stop:887 length:471 start_codon:yes stop_codon:yes gene_type:complete